MIDITKCQGIDCPIKEKCYRFTSPSDGIGQVYFTNSPCKDGNCEYLMDI